MRKLLFVILLFIAACTKEEDPTTGNSTTNNNTSTNSQTGDFTTDMLAAVNKLRATGCTCGGQNMPIVPALKWNKLLEASSLRHAKDMNTNNFFTHIGSDGSTVQSRIEATGYKWTAIGENIAKGYTSIPDVITGWLNSTPHCKQMMSADITELGAARTGNYWVQDFGKPR